MYIARASIRNTGQQMFGPDSSNGSSFRHESEGWGFESTSNWDIFCLTNFNTSRRTSFRDSKNECCCPHTVNNSNVDFTTKVSFLGLKLNSVSKLGPRNRDCWLHNIDERFWRNCTPIRTQINKHTSSKLCLRDFEIFPSLWYSW